MKHDIHEISNELYTNRQQAKIDKENKERKKKYIQDIKYTLQEEIDNFIYENDKGNINDIQLQVLDNQDTIIDYTCKRILDKDIYKVTRLQVTLDLKEIFLSQFNYVFKEYKTRCNIQKEINKQSIKNRYNDILEKLIVDFDRVNNQKKYDMKIVLKNMSSEEYINDVFNYLDLKDTSDNRDIYYKAIRELKRRKKDTIKEVVMQQEKQKRFPLSWKCYGILKTIDKMIK